LTKVGHFPTHSSQEYSHHRNTEKFSGGARLSFLSPIGRYRLEKEALREKGDEIGRIDHGAKGIE
jgi:hypothetical protein